MNFIKLEINFILFSGLKSSCSRTEAFLLNSSLFCALSFRFEHLMQIQCHNIDARQCGIEQWHYILILVITPHTWSCNPCNCMMIMQLLGGKGAMTGSRTTPAPLHPVITRHANTPTSAVCRTEKAAEHGYESTRNTQEHENSQEQVFTEVFFTFWPTLSLESGFIKFMKLYELRISRDMEIIS